MRIRTTRIIRTTRLRIIVTIVNELALMTLTDHIPALQ